MTQDDLKARLLLLGFRFARTCDSFTYRDSHGSISVSCSLLSPGDVNVSYREHITPTRTRSEWKGFRASPEAVYNFLKEKLT